MNPTAPYHEQLFDEICGKLQELEHKEHKPLTHEPSESSIQAKLDKLHQQLVANQTALLEKIRHFDFVSESPADLSAEIEKLTILLETERTSNSKLSADLARALDLNLKLQFDIEDTKRKTKDLQDKEKSNFTALENKLNGLEKENLFLKEQMNELEAGIDHFEDQSRKQSENIQSLTQVAEKKMIELKMSLDKKTFQHQEAMNHFQKVATQLAVLKQENQTLRDYIQKMTALHETRNV